MIIFCMYQLLTCHLSFVPLCQDDASVAKLSQFSIRGWQSNMEDLPPAGLFKAY